MPPDRVTQIQKALIQHGYQTGEPTGKWDAQTAAAMQKLQADHGWQTKITPDSRALILLGLGPHNAESAAGSVAGAVSGPVTGLGASVGRNAEPAAGDATHTAEQTPSTASDAAHTEPIMAQTQPK
ncbi:MAG: peptidoglycan-binding domain-containing protein [Acidobacteriaceae bacterium]